MEKEPSNSAVAPLTPKPEPVDDDAKPPVLKMEGSPAAPQAQKTPGPVPPVAPRLYPAGNIFCSGIYIPTGRPMKFDSWTASDVRDWAMMFLEPDTPQTKKTLDIIMDSEVNGQVLHYLCTEPDGKNELGIILGHKVQMRLNAAALHNQYEKLRYERELREYKEAVKNL